MVQMKDGGGGRGEIKARMGRLVLRPNGATGSIAKKIYRVGDKWERRYDESNHTAFQKYRTP